MFGEIYAMIGNNEDHCILLKRRIRMANSRGRKMSIAVFIAVMLVLSAAVISAADGVAPGSEQDPIVTQSYVEQKAEQVKYYIDTLIATANEGNTVQNQEIEKLKSELKAKDQEIAQLKETVGNAGSAGSGKFEVVELAKNQILSGRRSGDNTQIGQVFCCLRA
jgi:cell division protein FtsL